MSSPEWLLRGRRRYSRLERSSLLASVVNFFKLRHYQFFVVVVNLDFATPQFAVPK
jgi:hypothetical protein